MRQEERLANARDVSLVSHLSAAKSVCRLLLLLLVLFRHCIKDALYTLAYPSLAPLLEEGTIVAVEQASFAAGQREREYRGKE